VTTIARTQKTKMAATHEMKSKLQDATIDLKE
jgi:hypothetical protein